MAEKQASGLKNYLSADDIDNPRFKSPGKLSSNLLGQFDSQPSLASTNKPNKGLSRSSPHLLQANTSPVKENSFSSSDNSEAKIDAGGQMTISEPEACSLPSCEEKELSKSEMVEEKDKKRKKRWKWSPWKKMRKIFGRKKGKRAKSCEDLPVATGHPAYKTTEEDSHGDSLRKRTKSEPTLSDTRAKKIGQAIADVHHSRLAAGSGGALVKELRKHRPGEGSQELVGDPSEETGSGPPSNLQWITSQPSAEEASVSFEEMPPNLMLVGLQAAHDKIRAAPKNRRPPARNNSGGSGGKKFAPMKPHRKSKTDPGGQIKKSVTSESDSISGVGPDLSLTDRNSRVVFESSETKGDKDDNQEKNESKVERSSEKNIGSDIKVDERTKGKPLLPPVLKPLLPQESEKVSEVVLRSSEPEKPSSDERKSSEVRVAVEPEDKTEKSDSREDVQNSVRERVNQILSAAPGSPKLGSGSSNEIPRPSPRSGVPLKPTPQSRQKWRDEKDKVSEALDDAFDLLETEEPVAKPKEEKVSEAAVNSIQEEKTSETTVNLPKTEKGSETALNSPKNKQGFEKTANASKDENISQTANRPRPAPRPLIPVKPKLPQKLHNDKKDVGDALEDAFSALESEKANPEIKEKESKSSGSPTPAPRRAVALKPVPKSRQKLRDEKSNGEQTKKELITENAKGHTDKTELNTSNGQKEKLDIKIPHLSNGKANDIEHSSHTPVLRSKSESQVKIIRDSGIKERSVIFSSIDSDQKTDISSGVSLKPVKTKQSKAKKENETSSPTKDVQLRNQQFLLRDTDNRKTCPPKLLASIKLTGKGESKVGGEQVPPWVEIANKRAKRLSQILEPNKAALPNKIEKDDSPPSVQPKPNSKPSVLTKPSSKTTNFTPSLIATDNRGSLSRSKSVGQTVLEKEKTKSLTRASSEDKPSPYDK